jgi:hypothetical protein
MKIFQKMQEKLKRKKENEIAKSVMGDLYDSSKNDKNKKKESEKSKISLMNEKSQATNNSIPTNIVSVDTLKIVEDQVPVTPRPNVLTFEPVVYPDRSNLKSPISSSHSPEPHQRRFFSHSSQFNGLFSDSNSSISVNPSLLVSASESPFSIVDSVSPSVNSVHLKDEINSSHFVSGSVQLARAASSSSSSKYGRNTELKSTPFSSPFNTSSILESDNKNTTNNNK